MMKKLLFVSAFLILSVCVSAQNRTTASYQPDQGQTDRLRAHVYFLASDTMLGRKAGSDDGLKAALYLADQYRSMGALPLSDDYLIPFTGSGPYMVMSGGNSHFRNVAVVIPGNDPALRHEYILIGGHYDHLGVKNGNVYNGADDNASGSAAVVEVARNLLARQKELHRSVIIANFDAEEIGLVGSGELAEWLSQSRGQDAPAIFAGLHPEKSPIVPLDYCRMMMSVDMVGWLKYSGSATTEGKLLTLFSSVAPGELEMQGSGTILHGSDLLTGVADKFGLMLKLKKFESSALTATDTEPFAQKGVPTLAVTTGVKSPYHKPEDDADLIDYEGLSKIVDYLTELAVTVSADSAFASSGRLALKHRGKYPFVEMGLQLGGGRNWMTYPDYSFTSDNGWGWNGGATMLFNFGQKKGMHRFVSLKGSVLYDQASLNAPNIRIDDNNELAISSIRYGRTAVNVPVSLRLNGYYAGSSFFIGAGAWSSWMLSQKAPAFYDRMWVGGRYYGSPNQSGWLWEFGTRMSKFELSALFEYQLTDRAPMRLHSTRVTFSYYLW